MDRKLLTGWHDFIGSLLRETESETVRKRLVGHLKALFGADSVILMLYHRGSNPAFLHNDTGHVWRKNNFDDYIAAFYILDPFYQAAMTLEKDGLVGLEEITPPDFERSEYYEAWYQGSGLVDEVNFMARSQSGGVIALSLARTVNTPRFSSQELADMRMIAPVVSALLHAHCKDAGTDTEKGRQLHRELRDALAAFGRDTLTPREFEIVQMLMHGYPAREIAERLDISMETVKVHRKRIYQKLDITSHAELFSLFLAALEADSSGGKGDPLKSFLASP